jgi:putative methyltransferase (TIGR04325 family)
MKTASLKAVLKSLLPPILWTLVRRLRGQGIRYLGHYSSWESARAQATGYDDGAILEKVAAAVAKVQSGEAAYERDSVLFSTIDYPFPLLSILLRAAAESDGSLKVIDFGGSLGSSYFQCRRFLDSVRNLDWRVVEQENFVSCGQARFSSDALSFHPSMDLCLQDGAPDVVLFASVLQYLPDFDVRIEQAVASGARYVVIDRTPFSEAGENWLCVQHVPSDIYAASYPCNILSKPQVMRLLQKEFELLGEFDCIGGKDNAYAGISSRPFNYQGMIWRRR